MKRLPLIASFVLFVALCASTAYWAMQLFKPPMRPVAAPPQALAIAPRLDAAETLFSGRHTVVVTSSFQLKGVIVAANEAQSVAILAVGGKPSQAVKNNAEVLPGVRVKEVHSNYVLLSEGGVMKRVELQKDVKPLAKPNVPSATPDLK